MMMVIIIIIIIIIKGTATGSTIKYTKYSIQVAQQTGTGHSKSVVRATRLMMQERCTASYGAL